MNVFLHFFQIVFPFSFASIICSICNDCAFKLNTIQSNVQKWTTKGIRCLLVFLAYIYKHIYMQRPIHKLILLCNHLLIQLYENTFYCTFMFDIFIMDSCLCYTVSSSLMSECLTSHKYTSGTSLAIWLAERILRLKRLYWLV